MYGMDKCKLCVRIVCGQTCKYIEQVPSALQCSSIDTCLTRALPTISYQERIDIKRREMIQTDTGRSKLRSPGPSWAWLILSPQPSPTVARTRSHAPVAAPWLRTSSSFCWPYFAAGHPCGRALPTALGRTLRRSMLLDWSCTRRVDEDTSDHGLRRAYRRLALENHPDKGGSRWDAADIFNR